MLETGFFHPVVITIVYIASIVAVDINLSVLIVVEQPEILGETVIGHKALPLLLHCFSGLDFFVDPLPQDN
jgi:hypothetical protein